MILDIIPRVNASGLVVLDIIQEVSDVVATVVTQTPQRRRRPPRQRSLSVESATTVAINSGETVALGGLIRDARPIR